MKTRTTKILLISLGALLSPLLLFTAFMAFTLINPMALGFLSRFEIQNTTGRRIWVTPIGAKDAKGTRHTLPLSFSSHVYLLRLFNQDFPIAPGETRRFVYDWDDTQFSEILVRDESGEHRVLPTGLHPIEAQFRQPDKDHFEVGNLGSLAVAQTHHLDALKDPPLVRLWRLYGIAAAGFLSPILIAAGLLMKNRENDDE